MKKGLECPGKVLEFHLHQRVDTLERSTVEKCSRGLSIYKTIQH
jgi:hypothetical protein